MRKKYPLFATVTLAVSLVLSGACSRKPARTDAQVASDVQNKIYSDAAVQSRQIEVQAANGVVTLTGEVGSDAERSAAANDAGSIDGVKTVINDLQMQQAQAVPQAPTAPAASAAYQQQVQEKPGKRDKRHSETARTRHNWSSRQVEDSPSETMQANNAPVAPPPVQQQAQPAAPAPPPPPPPPQKVTVPAGTQLSVRLNDPLDSERNQVGDTFHATLSSPIVLDGETIIPEGADVLGRVADVKSAGRFAGNSVLTLELTSLSINGRTYNLQTNQWSRSGKGEGKNTATKVGIGTAAGAILGGIIGGGKGAAIGAATGAGAGTGVAASRKGEQIRLGPEAVLNFQTINTLTVTPQGQNSRNAGRTPLS